MKKKRITKKLISILLATVLSLSVLTIAPFSVSAAVDNASFANSINSLKQRYINGQYWNKYCASDYSHTGTTPCPGSSKGVSCVSRGYCGFGDGCTCLCGAYVYGGVERAWQCLGFACKMGYEIFGDNPFSWSKHTNASEIKPGDIIYGNLTNFIGGASTHAIFITGVSGETVTFVDCNRTGPCRVSWDNTTTKSAIQTAINNPSKNGLYGYISHSYNNGVSSGLVDNNDNSPVDLGTNFYALITHKASWNHLTAEESSNVDICWEDYSIKQYWKFIRQSDGSYKIKNAGSGLCLEVKDGSSSDQANVQVGKDNNSDAQKWIITKCGEGHQFRAKCTSCVMEMNAWSFSQGVNLVVGAKDNSDAEIFAINKRDINQYGKPTLNALVENERVKFSWNVTPCTTNYNIVLCKGTSINSDDYIGIWDVKNNSYELCLENGNYVAYIEGYNAMADYIKSDIISFNVSVERSEELGTDFYALITHKTSWNHLTAEESSNVDICWEDYSIKQYWKFIRQSDGSYKIKNAGSGLCLEVKDGSSSDQANVQVGKDNNSDAQKWIITKCGEGYQFRAKCTSCVMEMNAWSFSQGVNLVVGTKDNSDAEIFAINKRDINQYGKPTLNALVENEKVKFSWNDTPCTTNYNIILCKGTSINSDDYIGILDVKNNSYEICLENGDYIAYIEGYNAMGDYIKSNTISFNVVHVGDANGDGAITIQDVTVLQQYCAQLIDLNDNQLYLADVNNDGYVDIADVTLIQTYIAGHITSFSK